jgi:hypothetical protein
MKNGIRKIRDIRGQILKKEQHVADVLPFVLPTKSLCHNVVADVADFSEVCINLACRAPLRGKFMVLTPFLPFHLQMAKFIQFFARQRKTKTSNMLLVCSSFCYRLSR